MKLRESRSGDGMTMIAKILVGTFLVLLLMSWVGELSAQEDSIGSTVAGESGRKKVVRYKKWTKINLDESLIEGELNDPGRIEIKVSPQKDFDSLLRPRTDFLKELRQDVDQVR
jgi:hypothetical protein